MGGWVGWLRGLLMACAIRKEESIAYGHWRVCEYACF